MLGCLSAPLLAAGCAIAVAGAGEQCTGCSASDLADAVDATALLQSRSRQSNVAVSHADAEESLMAELHSGLFGVWNGRLQEELDEQCGFAGLSKVGRKEPAGISGLETRETSQQQAALATFWKAAQAAHLKKGVTSAGKSQRYLRYVDKGAGQGIGNLLHGLIGAWYLAAHSGRALVVDWPALEVALEPRFVDWRKPAVLEGKTGPDFTIWNFREMKDPSALYDAVRGDDEVVTYGGNVGPNGFFEKEPKAKGLLGPTMNFPMLQGLPDNVTLASMFFRDAAGTLPRKKIMAAGCAFHFLFAPTKQMMTALKERLGEKPSLMAVQLRFGDKYLTGQGKTGETRPVLSEYGLDLAQVVNKALHCAIDVCEALPEDIRRGQRCSVYLESDSEEAKDVARKWKDPSLRVRVPEAKAEHSVSGTAQTFLSSIASLVALSGHSGIVYTFGDFGRLSNELGPMVLPRSTSVLLDSAMQENKIYRSLIKDKDVCNTKRLMKHLDQKGDVAAKDV